jgi:nitrogenase molybdenum-iron protein alpha/beta subunit
MPGIDYSSHVTNTAVQGPATAVASAKTANASDFSFDDLLDIVNPLQHIPVISTLYRAITGDKIGTPEKIAGDTLYGGLVGLFASLGDAAFKEITGKDVGDTVLAFLTGDDSTPVQTAASEKPVQVTSAESVSTPDMSALLSALSGKGVNAGTAARAAYAYGHTIGLTTTAALLPPS